MIFRRRFLFLASLNLTLISCNLDEVRIKSSYLSLAVREILLKSFKVKFNNFHIVTSVEERNEQKCSDLISEIVAHADGEMSVQIEKYSAVEIPSDERKRYPVVAIIDTFESFLQLNTKLTYDRFKVRRSFVFVLLDGNSSKLLEVFDILWSKFIVNTNVIISDGDKIQMLTFIPFKDEKCSDLTPVVVNKFKEGQWESKKFYPKKFSNLFNCSLKLGAALNFPAVMAQHDEKGFYGVELNLLNMLADKMNFKIDLKLSAERGAIFENGTATGLMKSLIDGEFDGILGFYSFQYMGTMLLGETRSYFMDPIVLIISTGEALTAFQKLFGPFEMLAWILISMVFAGAFLTVLVLRFSSRKIFDLIVEPRAGNVFVNILKAILGQTQQRLPTGNFTRWLLLNFLIFCFIIRTMYAGQLFKLLQTPQFEKEAETISELVDKKFTFYVHDNMDQPMENFRFSER